MKKPIRVNERGIRIGESHPNARLSDLEVEHLIADRGPPSDPRMSLGKLSKKYGISKSGVKAILDGRCRAQVSTSEKVILTKPVSSAEASRKVRCVVSLTLADRARFHRYGGSAWLRRMLKKQRALAPSQAPMKEVHHE